MSSHFGTIEFTRAAPPVINWRKRVCAALDAIADPAFTAADDWAIIEAMGRGMPIPKRQGFPGRAFKLVDCARDDQGSYKLDGRAALIAECKARAGA